VTAFLNVLPQGLCDMADDELCIDNSPSFNPQKQRFVGHGYSGWPRLCTLRGWLTYCADLHGLPEREDLRALASYCALDHEHGADQRDKLVALSETQASALYADYILREKRTWRDVLYDFDSLRHKGSHLTVEALLGLLPPIRYREFSIASSPSKIRQETKSASMIAIELCVAVVEGTTRLGRSYHGLCSHYLSQLSDNGSAAIRFWIRPGSFHGLPLQRAPNSSLPLPVIYIGAGTGIAPLRSLIQERHAILEATAIATKVSSDSQQNDGDEEELERSDILVFGCRKREADFYYAAEWNTLRHSGRLGLFVAFSRDQWQKIYVQQVIQKADQDTKFLSRHILERSGSIYIAGGPLMARSVKEVILESVAKETGGDDKQSQRVLTKMQQNGSFSIEAWN
jgi:sulfite reductase alpha subunit-like flavoprotein